MIGTGYGVSSFIKEEQMMKRESLATSTSDLAIRKSTGPKSIDRLKVFQAG
jgi:hypothetical protein